MRTTTILLLATLSTFFASSAAFSAAVITTDPDADNPSSKTLPIPNNFSVEYILQSGFFDIGKTKRTLSLQKDGLYIFTSTTKATGMFAVFFNGKITERSIWEFYKGRARPLQYSYKDTNKKKRNVSLAFDWDKKTVTNTINGEPWKMEITPDTQDKLIYQINIMLSLLEDSNIEIMNINVADGGKLKNYDAIIQEKETIETPAGKFETIRVSRDDGKRVTTLWCAPELNYLPVRIEHYKKGDTHVNAYLVKVKGLSLKEKI
jgi:hypothetical protein